jgi:hypothetical protein
MTRALKGALDYVINDIRPEGQEYIDFLNPANLEMFGFHAREAIIENMKDLEYATEPVVDEVLSAVGEQFANTEGPDFGAIIKVGSLVLMEDNQKGAIMTRVKNGIVTGVEKAVEQFPLEKKYQRAAMRALEEGMRMVTVQFEAFV